jgi:N-methylhydantoinase A
MDSGVLASTVSEMTQEAHLLLRQEGVAVRDIRVQSAADLRYVGQAYELTIPIPSGNGNGLQRPLADAFHHEHRSRYGHALGDDRIELVNLRVSGIGLTVKPLLKPTVQMGTKLLDAHVRDHFVYVGASERLKVPIFSRKELPSGVDLPSPSLITQLDATTFIPAGANATVDSLGSIVLSLP